MQATACRVVGWLETTRRDFRTYFRGFCPNVVYELLDGDGTRSVEIDLLVRAVAPTDLRAAHLHHAYLSRWAAVWVVNASSGSSCVDIFPTTHHHLLPTTMLTTHHHPPPTHHRRLQPCDLHCRVGLAGEEALQWAAESIGLEQLLVGRAGGWAGWRLGRGWATLEAKVWGLLRPRRCSKLDAPSTRRYVV